MRNIVTIIKKQLKDTLKNKTVLIQFVMFPVLTLIFEQAINIPDMPELFFTKLFSVMYMGMAPLTAVASIIAEEKEKNTLRVLTMANVKAWEYLAGIGIYVWTICMAGAGVMATTLSSGDIPFLGNDPFEYPSGSGRRFRRGSRAGVPLRQRRQIHRPPEQRTRRGGARAREQLLRGTAAVTVLRAHHRTQTGRTLP